MRSQTGVVNKVRKQHIGNHQNMNHRKRFFQFYISTMTRIPNEIQPFPLMTPQWSAAQDIPSTDHGY